MSFYGSRIPHYIEGKNEEDLRKKLLEISTTMGQKLEVMSIYPKSTTGKVVAWYFHDLKTGAPPKKTTKKKVTKKA